MRKREGEKKREIERKVQLTDMLTGEKSGKRGGGGNIRGERADCESSGTSCIAQRGEGEGSREKEEGRRRIDTTLLSTSYVWGGGGGGGKSRKKEKRGVDRFFTRSCIAE